MSVSCTPSDLVVNAKCFMCLSEKQLLAINSYLLCQILNSGGGGGGTTQIFAGDYGGNEPNFTPSTSVAYAFDTSNGQPWAWYDGAWH